MSKKWLWLIILVLVATGFLSGALVLPGCVDSETPSADFPKLAIPAAEKPEPVVEELSEPPIQALEQSTEDYFVGSRKSDVYHYPSCHYVRRIKAQNLTRFDSVEQARARGYRPCKVCCPPS